VGQVRVNQFDIEPCHFRPMREGPEATLQGTVSNRLRTLFPLRENPVWVGGSVPVGAGLPDIVLAAYEPELPALADADHVSISIIAYLRAVPRARLETVASRIGKSIGLVEERISHLLRANIVILDGYAYALNKCWRSVLPEVISIEVKVSNWQKAIQQASRNRIFSNKSYIALPQKVAERAHIDPFLCRSGIGILSVSEDLTVRALRKAKYARPKAWTYYYTLASLAAVQIRKGEDGISAKHSRGCASAS